MLRLVVYRKVVIKFRCHTNENDFYAADYVLEFVWYAFGTGLRILKSHLHNQQLLRWMKM